MAAMLTLWTARLTTFLLWTLAAASAAFWFLQQLGSAVTVDVESSGNLPQPLLQSQSTEQVALALGANAAAIPTAASALAANQARFQLLGVLAVGAQNLTSGASGTHGAALLSVDGKPAKPYRVGAAIDEGLEVMSVAARSVSIGFNGVIAFTLELPLKN
jgi:general secretion pathway protein C